MIAALLLAAAPYAEAYDSVLEAEMAAEECEHLHLGHVFHPPSGNPEELRTQAKRVCASFRDEFRTARLAYYAKYRRSMRRVVPGFRPELEICWQALQTEVYRWPGMDENTARRDCKNARN